MIVLIMCMAFLGSFLLTRAIRKYALALQLIDIPNDRSSHKRPTPRGGGLAFVLIFFSIVVFLYQASLISTPFALASSAAGLFVAFLGFIDDKRHLSPKIRFSGHFLASGFVLYCFGCFPSIQIANWIVPSGWIMNGLGLFYLTWMLNLLISWTESMGWLLQKLFFLFGCCQFVLDSWLFFRDAPAHWACSHGFRFLDLEFPPGPHFYGGCGQWFPGNYDRIIQHSCCIFITVPFLELADFIGCIYSRFNNHFIAARFKRSTHLGGALHACLSTCLSSL